jgi:CRP-like cAMP-binding protein
MVLFLGGGSFFLVAAVLLFSWTIWRDVHARLDSIATKQFTAGQTIFRQGEPAEHVFVITRGQVEAVYEDPTRGEVVIGRLGPDEFFGESAILSRLPRQVTARAVGDVELLAVHRTDFLQLYSSLPRLRARIQARQTHRHALVREAAKGNASK